MISLKRFLDMQSGPQVVELEPEELLATTKDCYRSVLLAVGKSAVEGCPAVGAELESNLQGLERHISTDLTPEEMTKTKEQIETKLFEWGQHTAEHLKAKADEVKELLLALARTAESVGDRDQCYTNQFKGLTSRLETIVNLDDLTLIRASLVERLTELKNSVDQMTRDSQRLVAQLRAEVSTYETRLRTVEHLILKDDLTGVENRRSIEERIQFNISHCQSFCIAMIDLNDFKLINDAHGHLAGDDLLRQFARELQVNTRSASDIVGRWGGDEFLVLLSCDVAGASLHTERIRDWVFGKYTIQCGQRGLTANVYMDASIGLAPWTPGETMQQLIAKADAAMYQDKQKPRVPHPTLRTA